MFWQEFKVRIFSKESLLGYALGMLMLAIWLLAAWLIPWSDTIRNIFRMLGGLVCGFTGLSLANKILKNRKGE